MRSAGLQQSIDATDSLDLLFLSLHLLIFSPRKKNNETNQRNQCEHINVQETKRRQKSTNHKRKQKIKERLNESTHAVIRDKKKEFDSHSECLLSDMPTLTLKGRSMGFVDHLRFFHRILRCLSQGQHFLSIGFGQCCCRSGFRRLARRGCCCCFALGFLSSSRVFYMLAHFIFESIADRWFLSPESERGISFTGRERIHRWKDVIDHGMEIFIPRQRRIEVLDNEPVHNVKTYEVERI